LAHALLEFEAPEESPMNTAAPTVEDRMTTSVFAMREGDTIEEARREMRRLLVHHVPIVDEAQHVVGIISARDLPRGLPPDTRVGDVMVRRVITVRPGDAAEHAAWLLLENGFHSLPVVGDGEQLVGIVTSRDLHVVAAHWAA
jgi:CBS domain-containing protein